LLHVEKSGAGPPLVAIHGFGASLYTWHAVLRALSGRHTVYAVDLKGFGQSPKPNDGQYSVHDQAALIRELMDAQELRDVTLVGHSFGGGVALALAVELERASPGTLASLILLDAAAYPQPLPSFVSILRLPVIGWLSQYLLPIEFQVRFVLKLAYYRDARIPDATVRAYATALGLPGGRRALRATAKQIIPKDIDALSAEYPTIRVPALLIWGRHDEIVPLWVGERLSRALPNARLLVIDDAGHVPHEETPDPVGTALRAFLAQPRGNIA